MPQTTLPERPAFKSKKQAAQYLGGVSERTVERMVKDGQLHPVKIRGRVMLKVAELDAIGQPGNS